MILLNIVALYPVQTFRSRKQFKSLFKDIMPLATIWKHGNVIASTSLAIGYMSMLSLNLKNPFPLRTPSIPSGSLGKGSTKILVAASGSELLSVTRTSPCALIDSTSAGIMSCTADQYLFCFGIGGSTNKKSRATYQSHEVIVLRDPYCLLDRGGSSSAACNSRRAD